ncbi:MAG: Na+/H+ antiporter NhaA [Bdellovibrionales bacterium]|nr:Na+/H+ antiporter NhaA [Bdellovibrionales bacterium]
MVRNAVRAVSRPFQAFFKLESSSGLLLMGTAAMAFMIANSPLGEDYAAIWKLKAGLSLEHWVNDALMAVFFLLVGVEIKREFTHGELSTRRKAALPVAGALGGMLVPAGIYWAFNGGGPAEHGWGIPMATDIAFALALLNLLGRTVPTSGKVFLTALAVADDIGAVVVIAVFYTASLAPAYLGAGALILAALALLNRAGVRGLPFYLVPGVALWFCFLKSGVHATVAGVLLAFSIPGGSGSPGARLERALHPWVAFGIMPVFAFANSGVSLGGSDGGLTGALTSPIGMGVALGLFAGKQIGIFGAAWLAVKSGLAQLPSGLSWRGTYGLAILGGIGFTMSLFVSMLAFSEPEFVDTAKLAVFCGSILSACAGFLYLKLTRRG